MNTEVEATITAARQISEKAARELQQLRERVPELERQLATLTEEQATLEQQRGDDAHTLEHARQMDVQATQRHKDALDYANYAVGTSGEREALRTSITLEQHAKETHRLYEETASSIELKERARTTRLEALRVEYDQARDELASAQARIEEVQRIEQRALQELGESTFERLQATRQEIHIARIERATEELTRAKIAEQQFADQALAELAPWPALQQQMRPDQQYSDEVTETCQRYIDLIDALIGSDQGNHLAALQQLPLVSRRHYHWKTLFQLSDTDLHPLNIIAAHRSTSKPIALLQQRTAMQAVLDAYRATKKGA
jgi:hypothetical protein